MEMEKSRILDKLKREETALKVEVLSANPRKPVNLEGTLIDYDSQGYLFRESLRDKSKEVGGGFVYLPSGACASMRFNSQDINWREDTGSEKYDVSYEEGKPYEEQLRSFREQARLTKVRLSKLVGISVSHVRNSEIDLRKTDKKGIGKISIEALEKILSVYNISPPEGRDSIIEDYLTRHEKD